MPFTDFALPEPETFRCPCLSRNFILSKQVQHPFVKKDLFRFSPQKLEKTYRDETSRDLLYWALNSYITGIVYSKTNKRHKID